ncbi:MAG: hypothetical protein WAT39_24240, partial [Planctomycetota bacterium]
ERRSLLVTQFDRRGYSHRFASKDYRTRGAQHNYRQFRRTTLAKSEEVAAARTAIALTVIPERDPAPVLALAAQRWLRLGEALARQKRDPEAVFAYRQAMASDASHFAAGIAAALLCQQRKDHAGAVRDANEVLRRDFGNAEAMRIRSKCLPAKIAEGR